MKDPQLAGKIAAFAIDRGQPALTFTDRLARENSWGAGYAERVIREYLRFIYMACVCDRPVTPSVAVDQAWHLHLVYTRSYWNELCGGVLNRPLHHGPTAGGEKESARYHDQYDYTLQQYQAEFGEAPPADIWPDASARFSRGASPVAVTRDSHWIVEKARVWKATRIAAVAGLGIAGAGAASAGGFIAFCAFLVLIALIAVISRRRSKDRSGKKKGWWGGGCGGCGSAGHGSGCGGDSGCGGGGCGGGD